MSCKGCIYWSERIARVQDCRMVAMCLNPRNERNLAEYTHRGCEYRFEHWQGAIDDPSLADSNAGHICVADDNAADGACAYCGKEIAA